MEITNEAEWIQIDESVAKLCDVVFSASREVLKSAVELGLDDFLNAPRPNAEDSLLRVRILESFFTNLISFFEQKDKFSLVTQMINAKQQILHLEMLINAAKSKNMEECNKLIRTLEAQAHLHC